MASDHIVCKHKYLLITLSDNFGFLVDRCIQDVSWHCRDYVIDVYKFITSCL